MVLQSGNSPVDCSDIAREANVFKIHKDTGPAKSPFTAAVQSLFHRDDCLSGQRTRPSLFHPAVAQGTRGRTGDDLPRRTENHPYFV